MGSPASKTRDLKVVELIERGFAALPVGASQPAALPAASTAAIPAVEIPTVKTDKTGATAEQVSTAAEPPFTFRVTPPQKKP